MGSLHRYLQLDYISLFIILHGNLLFYKITLAFLSSLNCKLLEVIIGHRHFMATALVKVTNHTSLFSILILFDPSGAIINTIVRQIMLISALLFLNFAGNIFPVFSFSLVHYLFLHNIFDFAELHLVLSLPLFSPPATPLGHFLMNFYIFLWLMIHKLKTLSDIYI